MNEDECQGVLDATNAFFARCGRPQLDMAHRCRHMIIVVDAEACRATLEAAECTLDKTPAPCKIEWKGLW